MQLYNAAVDAWTTWKVVLELTPHVRLIHVQLGGDRGSLFAYAMLAPEVIFLFRFVAQQRPDGMARIWLHDACVNGSELRWDDQKHQLRIADVGLQFRNAQVYSGTFNAQGQPEGNGCLQDAKYRLIGHWTAGIFVAGYWRSGNDWFEVHQGKEIESACTVDEDGLPSGGGWWYYNVPPTIDDPAATKTKTTLTTYFGVIEHGKRHGPGKTTDTRGNFYMGEYRHDQRWGNGFLFENNTVTYNGQWESDQRHGKCSFAWLACPPYHIQFEGEFDRDRPLRGKWQLRVDLPLIPPPVDLVHVCGDWNGTITGFVRVVRDNLILTTYVERVTSKNGWPVANVPAKVTNCCMVDVPQIDVKNLLANCSEERCRMPNCDWRWQLGDKTSSVPKPANVAYNGKLSVKIFLTKLCESSKWNTTYVNAGVWRMFPHEWAKQDYVFRLASLLKAIERYLLKETPKIILVDYLLPQMNITI